MESLKWAEEKDKREKEALERHATLSRLFRKDRFAFERERKRMIDEVIGSVKDEEQRNRLRALQERWDKIMKSAGSKHNRFVLAQTFFWEHFHETWHPAILKFNVLLNGKPDCQES
ncbi:MAG: DUF3135 domain-containing protein [Deltaproteobacteria bacterium]|nr:DUF3135 domain-containing protein [Deltaproteobacteria bacterium]MBW1739159.1 DUF3135 domain-containing protein [Deltaproteobacteria bacterium]MBW1911245.1 DUF3135 domain-containing protein [Deltaproteobacteria bacterium]MBW2035576.1 DUF3135 domain-containing protein [Deltaproteobacteria bacterium]